MWRSGLGRHNGPIHMYQSNDGIQLENSTYDQGHRWAVGGSDLNHYMATGSSPTFPTPTLATIVYIIESNLFHFILLLDANHIGISTLSRLVGPGCIAFGTRTCLAALQCRTNRRMGALVLHLHRSNRFVSLCGRHRGSPNSGSAGVDI